MVVYLFSSNLPAPINVGSLEQTKTGNLIIEGVLRLGQFATAPPGTEGALYFNTAEKKTKVYSNTAWGDLGGGAEPGQLPTYTTAERDALSPSAGLMIYNTDYDQVQTYTQTAWSGITGSKDLGIECASAMDCASGFCVDSVCCDTSLDNCSGNCRRCNVAGSMGVCIDVDSDCTGNCDVCTSGNCAASASLCTGNCDQCTGSGTAYSCSANASVCTGNCVTCSGSGTAYSCTAVEATCTGNCDVCSGSGTAYNCAASNALCSNTTSSCNCSGSGTAFNCSTCPDTYGLCGHPTCSSYTCGQAYDNGAACSTCHTCSSGSCTVHVPAGSTGMNCTAAHYRCDGAGNCTAPTTTACIYGGISSETGTNMCVRLGYDGCSVRTVYRTDCTYTNIGCGTVTTSDYLVALCWSWTY